jgi:hypothetical protein
MGDTVRFAERMRLVEMEPRGDLTSTGYALANEGEEYLVLQPNEAAEPFTVTPEAGTYRVEWFGVDSRETANAGDVVVRGFHLDQLQRSVRRGRSCRARPTEGRGLDPPPTIKRGGRPRARPFG